MPRNYIRKTTSISGDVLKNAVRSVVNGASILAASIQFEINYSTIHRHVQNHRAKLLEIEQNESPFVSIFFFILLIAVHQRTRRRFCAIFVASIRCILWIEDKACCGASISICA